MSSVPWIIVITQLVTDLSVYIQNLLYNRVNIHPISVGVRILSGNPHRWYTAALWLSEGYQEEATVILFCFYIFTRSSRS